jgi:hypothetical protein
MRLIAVAEGDARAEAREAGCEVRPVFVPKVGRELVDGDGDDELGRLGCWLSSSRSRNKRRCCGSKNLRMSLLIVIPANAGIHLYFHHSRKVGPGSSPG